MMQRSKSILVPLALLCFTTLAITGCGATSEPLPEQSNATTPGQPNETSPDATNTDGKQGEAVFNYGDNTYAAELQFCSLAEGQDALFHGVAHDDTGSEVGYLDGDFGILDGNLHGEVRIDFGATGQFESTDEFIAMGSALNGIVATDFSDVSWHIMGGGWDQDGVQQSNTTLKVVC